MSAPAVDTASEKWRSVEIIALGPVLDRTLSALGISLEGYLACPVRLTRPGPSIESAFDPRRGQYAALTLLELIEEPKPPAVLRLGVTRGDLFLPVFTHILGAARLGGRIAVVSLFRLTIDGTTDAHDPSPDRLLKEALHELGHAAGLIHCHCAWCAMAPSRTAEEVDLKDSSFCPSCARRVGVGPTGGRRADGSVDAEKGLGKGPQP
ncbi:MAG TPA: peptidase M54 [Acidobacteria bacterium]|nr:peptidase M54 [Acidobacteriota bacterium]